MTIIQLSRNARQHFPLAGRVQRVRQAVRLAKAKEYLATNNIDAVVIGSKFKYERATGSIL